MKSIYCYSIIAFLFFSAPSLAGQSLEKQIGDTLNHIVNKEVWVGNIVVRSINFKKKTVQINVNEALGNFPFREEMVQEIYNAIRFLLPSKQKTKKIYCKAGRYYIEQLVPNYYRKNHIDLKRKYKEPRFTAPLLRNLSLPYEIRKGLQNRHIALWQSHGFYYNQKLARWGWQRARLNQTVEDLYTQAYVLPFLAPMLENAGATVLIPRERDTQKYEVIVDNDNVSSQSEYIESSFSDDWMMGLEKGFAHSQEFYLHGENPFEMGTYRKSKTTRKKDEVSQVAWVPYIPEAGSYAVYVSYKTVPKSCSKAHYEVHHKGGKTEFQVNQNMFGGTWLYLGHFDFEAGKSDQGKVVLSNLSKEKNKIVTADAVKFGGGMGNIARMPYRRDTIAIAEIGSRDDENLLEIVDMYKDTIVPVDFYTPEISLYPRFTEGSRYWLQWAGVPDTIYSRSNGLDDYTDDYQSRPFWVNYIAGGSSMLPNTAGLNVPVDLAMAFHSDSGLTPNDSIIGTLGICSTRSTDKRLLYKNKASRLAARDLTDIIQTQIVDDIRLLHNPKWTRRGTWDRSYSESREPEVPTMLLEILSHQNFADMRYGLDPRFRFNVSRAIYKGMLKYIHSVYGGEYVVQPLPVESFGSRFTDKGEVELKWLPTVDSIEPTAAADHYVLYTRIDNGGFDNGRLIKKNSVLLSVESDKIYSFKITAVNKGGESFPSEILSVCRSSTNKGELLVVNCFDRLSAPESFMLDSTYAGFINSRDAGVPYLHDISFTGAQYEFARSKAWTDDDSPGHGASHSDYETMPVAGNSFDYPFLHGKAIKEAGYSFVSCSQKSITNDLISLNDYKIVDLILGKQKEIFEPNKQTAGTFKIFPVDLQERIVSFCENGGNLLLSAAYLLSETMTFDADKQFLEKVLRCKFRTSNAALTGKLRIVQSPFSAFTSRSFSYFNEPNESSYYVESPCAIEAIDTRGYTICRYAENNLSAGIVYDAGTHRICAFGFPFETIKEESDRNVLMDRVLKFLSSEESRGEDR